MHTTTMPSTPAPRRATEPAADEPGPEGEAGRKENSPSWRQRLFRQ
jgi:hypothetical protein